MQKVYDFVGGRKMFVAFLLFALSGSLWFFNRDIMASDLFQFWEWVTAILVVGNVSSKFANRAPENK
jgi:hypothetical protein